MRSQDPHVEQLLDVRILVEDFRRRISQAGRLQQDGLELGKRSQRVLVGERDLGFFSGNRDFLVSKPEN